jgi:hypothetical protein
MYVLKLVPIDCLDGLFVCNSILLFIIFVDLSFPKKKNY